MLDSRTESQILSKRDPAVQELRAEQEDLSQVWSSFQWFFGSQIRLCKTWQQKQEEITSSFSFGTLFLHHKVVKKSLWEEKWGRMVHFQRTWADLFEMSVYEPSKVSLLTREDLFILKKTFSAIFPLTSCLPCCASNIGSIFRVSMLPSNMNETSSHLMLMPALFCSWKTRRGTKKVKQEDSGEPKLTKTRQVLFFLRLQLRVNSTVFSTVLPKLRVLWMWAYSVWMSSQDCSTVDSPSWRISWGIRLCFKHEQGFLFLYFLSTSLSLLLVLIQVCL
jgi:hypothetical protein